VSSFLGALQFDINAFEDYFPAAVEFNSVIRGFAVGLLFIMLIFQIFRNFGIMLNDEVEDPLQMLGKTTLFFGMITYSRSIMRYIIKLLVDPYSIFLDTYSADFSFSITGLVDNIIGGASTSSIMSIVYTIMLLMLGWQLLKFVMEVVERYVVFYFILYCAPVVFATGAFKSTSQIFKSWCRMLGSQAMLLLLNIWSIKLFTSFMMDFNFSVDSIILYFLMGYGFLKFSQKADTLLRILGLNTASSGSVVSSLGSTIGGIAQVMRTMGGAVARSGGGKGNLGLFSGGRDRGGNGSGNAVSGMIPPSSGSGGVSKSTQNLQSPTATAATRYANDVLASAKSQMQSIGNSASGAVNEGNKAENIDATVNNASPVGGEKATSTVQSIDADTKEGLDNLARGLPHDKYNADTRKHSGGGFPEFTGENANIIGASQLAPKTEVSQSAVKMPDGSNATIYEDSNTGKSHLVQVGSVDNGIIQGCISEMDAGSGKPGDAMAFKAVHESVPGAETFSTHSVPISDGSGGSYHIASGADMSFLQSSIAQPSASMQTANSLGASTEINGSQDIPAQSLNVPSFSSNSQSSGTASTFGTSDISNHAPSIAPLSALSQTDNASATAQNIGNSTQIHIQSNPPSNVPQNSPSRFSRNNPANTEVFRRNNQSEIETFSRNQADTENTNNPMKRKESPHEKKK